MSGFKGEVWSELIHGKAGAESVVISVWQRLSFSISLHLSAALHLSASKRVSE